MGIDYNKWPVITCPEDLPEDGSLDRMFAEWLVATGVIDREDFDLQVRLTRANRSARLKALKDWEAEREPDTLYYNSESKVFTQNGVSFVKRVIPFKRGHNKLRGDCPEV